jgi:hypothetical protein
VRGVTQVSIDNRGDADCCRSHEKSPPNEYHGGRGSDVVIHFRGVVERIDLAKTPRDGDDHEEQLQVFRYDMKPEETRRRQSGRGLARVLSDIFRYVV